MTNKGRRFLQFFLLCLLFPVTGLFGQCPDRTALWERTHSLGEQGVSADIQIMELEGYRSQIKSCAHPGDTVYAYLLQTLGALYNNQSNFKQAVRITYEAIDLLNSAKIDSGGKFAKAC